jgi:hypothetical protein
MTAQVKKKKKKRKEKEEEGDGEMRPPTYHRHNIL